MKDENLNWIDALRVLATFSVIVLHVSADILYQYGSISDLAWWAGNIYDSTVRFCVPMFLMISGALILPKTYNSIGEYLKKRLGRILLPFLFWSLIYIVRDLFLTLNSGEHLSAKGYFYFIFLRLRNGASYHLWFIYLLIGIYLFFPVIGTWIRNSNKNEIRYFLGIWLITLFAYIPFIAEFIPKIELVYFTGYIGFPILGYYLSTTTFNFKGKKAVYFLCISAGILFTIVATWLMTKERKGFYEGFYEYLSLNVVLVSAGIFLLFKEIKFDSKIIQFFSKYSYGTYLSHLLIWWLLGMVGVSFNLITPIIGIPVTSTLCFIISTAVIWGINKLPGGKYISG